MSIKSGQCYKITNEHTKLVIDLSRADSDHKSIIGWIFHGGENQKWITEKQVNGQWTIRSVCASAQKYLGVEKTLDNGTLLVGRDEPQFWDIEILPGCEDSTRLRVKFCHLSSSVEGLWSKEPDLGA
ncbi:ricin B-like lectin [Lactarius psammicola]|nr:ricin B-like lectin [Lactarius psammicola]